MSNNWGSQHLTDSDLKRISDKFQRMNIALDKAKPKKMNKGGVALKGYSPILLKPQRFQGIF